MLSWAGKQGREVRGPFSKARTRRRRPSEFPRPEPASNASGPASAERAPEQGHAVPSIPLPSSSDPSRRNGRLQESGDRLERAPMPTRTAVPATSRFSPGVGRTGDLRSVGTSPPEVKNRARLRAIVAKLSSRLRRGAGRALRRASDPLSWVEDTSSRNAARTSGRPSTGRASTRRQPPDPASPSGCRNAGSGS